MEIDWVAFRIEGFATPMPPTALVTETAVGRIELHASG